ncbi:thiamine ABC transporter ATP-binding protein [Salipiger aestuarii]|uniref:Thiamine transport system ATP-binding protein n=1 Tax=Salipiger aestuarii TaxID=568098 RepID=A0A327YK11_9RHOB|nr:ATP-binding cassette domain-containing protein [Salipiger aestuarii]KAA8612330.1 thiamine ABC transporter ATP-binding protein [Salipiger aestuarii]KAB2541458.1 thiamine ABC transporter ATP-binding protein [Salipiger aestuarii]RAK20095.1 thiamine transport system ATP-binding protein [Salipiger aestuarii]
MLTLEAVEFETGRFRLAADFAVAAGRRVAVVGPSGAGKSTLLDLVAGFRMPASGRVLWQGRDITHDPPNRRPIAMLFQENNMFPHLDLVRNLGLALRPDGGALRRKELGAVETALTRVGLAGMEDRRPGALSGGQQSRAALARVLLQARPVIALDEPFAALGPALKREMLTLVRDVAQDLGALVLLVSHDPGDARGFAQDTVLVADGTAQPPVETEALFSDPPDALRAYLGT